VFRRFAGSGAGSGLRGSVVTCAARSRRLARSTPSLEHRGGADSHLLLRYDQARETQSTRFGFWAC
jgi:hypothetical protein